ncbi:hypothetical protein D7V96_05500 [bacterium D16-59]|nr:hypothetical protein D7V96_05500 [bacterium D16-59]
MLFASGSELARSLPKLTENNDSMIFRAGLQNALVLVSVTDAKHPPQTLCTITHSVQRERTEPKYLWNSVVSVQTVVRARASAGSLKSKAILKELNCPAESNVFLNFCQIVIYRTLSLFCRKYEDSCFLILHNTQNIYKGK